MNAIYWGLTALCVMDAKDTLDREETIAFVMSCWDDEAGGCVSSVLPPSASASHLSVYYVHVDVSRLTDFSVVDGKQAHSVHTRSMTHICLRR